MKFLLFSFALVSVLGSGCAFHQDQQTWVLDPVGPPPQASAPHGSTGSLLVFSAFSSTPDFNASPYRRRYTDYRIFSGDGEQLVQTVHNDSGILLEGPKRVALSPGKYTVMARANGYGAVTVPVVILASQTTIVHLEGSAWWPNRTAIAESNPVRLPHGEIAGWRAQQTEDIR